jgi:RNase H-like domain found in reverse transcriptase/Integrase core domain/Chromo (CHRromatin Organisation MOdifier) domain/Integrase zinc binding domain
VLYQIFIGEDGKEEIRYISFMARSLQESERKYSTTQKELLAIVFALKKFHYYLWGHHFTLYCDHRALSFLHSQKDLSPMVTGWLDTILDYTFKIVYRPGILNVLPDALSRQFPKDLWTAKPKNIVSKVYAYVHLIQDKNTVRNDVPKIKRQTVLTETHAIGHVGANAMVNQIHAQGQTWMNLAKDCLDYVQRCPECQRHNIVRKGYHPMKAIHATMPGDHMAVDLTGPFSKSDDGNTFLLVLVDICTRFVFLKPLPNKEANTVAKTLFDIFTTIGFPKILQSDNGKEFANTILRTMSDEFGMKHRFTTPYHPRGNGVAENHVKTAKSIIVKEMENRDHTWDRHVPMAQLAMNTRIVALHNSSPFSLFFARRFNGFHNVTDEKNDLLSQKEMIERLEYMTKTVFPAIDEKSRATQQRMIERFNRTVLHSEFPDGSQVMVLDPIRGDKFAPRYEGPYTIVRKNTGGAYILKDGTGTLLTRRYAPSQLKLALDSLTEPSYEVEKILDARFTPEKEGVPAHYEYLVKWKDYESEFNTWEPEKNFIERRCIREFWKDRDPPDSTLLTQPRLPVEASEKIHQRQGRKNLAANLMSPKMRANEIRRRSKRIPLSHTVGRSTRSMSKITSSKD